MPNRLAQENSPYLLQHRNNPVDWYPWGKEALTRAKKENKPIFLSIGYAACHWCHVMEHESFEDEDTAKLMNENFVNIKVDREERPDLDGIYMSAVVSLTGQGGWPMSVFLTPEGRPFYGGTYFPPTPQHGLPSFPELLERVGEVWKEDPEGVRKSGNNITEHLSKSVTSNARVQVLSEETISRSLQKLRETYDWKNGGWGNAPKFPQPMAIRFLLMQASKGDEQSLEVATHALKTMASGGMYDVVGGGFSRYSVDDNWLIPHFEKMLYDNAQLARAYLYAYIITRDEYFRRICDETLHFIARELTDGEGGFYSSLDADSEGVEGIFYTWELQEINKLLTDPLQKEIFIRTFDITEAGNFEGRNVLKRVLSDEDLSKGYDLSVEEIGDIISKILNQLYIVRSKRIWPGLDDKVLVSWNSLALITFSEAARYLKDPKYLQIAKNNANFLLNNMNKKGKLSRSWRKGKSKYNAYLEDYSSLILGLLSLYQSNPDTRWYSEAKKLAEKIIADFTDPAGGFFDTEINHEKLIVRPKELQDNALPAGNSLAATALMQIASFEGNDEYHQLAVEIASTQQEFAAQHPTALSQWLCAISVALNPSREIAIIHKGSPEDAYPLLDVIWEELRPFTVVAISQNEYSQSSPPLIYSRDLIDGKPTAYVCNNFSCKLPVTTPEKLREQLDLDF